MNRTTLMMEPERTIYKVSAASSTHKTSFMSLEKPEIGEYITLLGIRWLINYVTQLTDEGVLYLTDLYHRDKDGNPVIAELNLAFKNISIIMTKVEK